MVAVGEDAGAQPIALFQGLPVETLDIPCLPRYGRGLVLRLHEVEVVALEGVVRPTR